MKKQGQEVFFKVFLGVILFSSIVGISLAQDMINTSQVSQEEAVKIPAPDLEPAAVKRDINTMDNVTLDFKDADIRNILKIIAQKSGVNIVATADVVGTVTIKLVEVPWILF
jgi:type II secretory pathway component HofQ